MLKMISFLFLLIHINIPKFVYPNDWEEFNCYKLIEPNKRITIYYLLKKLKKLKKGRTKKVATSTWGLGNELDWIYAKMVSWRPWCMYMLSRNKRISDMNLIGAKMTFWRPWCMLNPNKRTGRLQCRFWIQGSILNIWKCWRCAQLVGDLPTSFEIPFINFRWEQNSGQLQNENNIK